MKSFLKKNVLLFYFSFLFLFLISCGKSERSTSPNSYKLLNEISVREIKLAGNFASRRNEYSGLAWWGNKLLLLPQYAFNPRNIAGGKFYLIEKERILDYLSNKDTSAITPEIVKVKIDGFEKFGEWGSGCEAIVFDDDTCFLSVEINGKSGTNAVLIKGYFNGSEFVFDSSNVAEVKSQTGISNLSEEAIGLSKENIFTVHEANGKNVNKNPVVHLFDKQLKPLSEIPFPNVEYRITDITSVDAEDKFWAVNYFYSGDESSLKPATDELFAKYGIGKSHVNANRVERLLEFKFSESGVNLVDRPPLYIKLNLKEDARNWEGIARLGNKGFLIITDTYPRTILGFLPVANGSD